LGGIDMASPAVAGLSLRRRRFSKFNAIFSKPPRGKQGPLPHGHFCQVNDLAHKH
jgi:hypothetical protein